MIGSALAIAMCLVVESPQARTLVLSVTLAAFTALEYHRSRNVLSPMIIVAGLFAWLYVAKPLYVFDHGIISAGTRADAIVVAGVWEVALSQALAAVTVTYCLVFVVFQVVVARDAPVRRERPWALDGPRYRLAAGAVTAVDVLAFGILVRSAGGLGGYVDGLALRSESLAGLSFLTLAVVPLNLLLLIGLTARLRGDPGAPPPGLLGVLGILALASAFLTGGRASLLTGLVLPLLVVVHYAHRRIGPALAMVMGFAGILAFVTLGALLRDTQFNRAAGQGPLSLIGSRLSNLHESLVGGVEAIPFDSLVRIMGAQQFGDLTWQGGDTYRSILTWPIPRMLWDGKPAGGGNAWFTETYVPRFYGDAKVESSISFVGESYANFGWAGVVLGSALFGILIGLVHARFASSTDTFALPLYAALMGFLLPAFRGDAYHNVTSGIFAVAVWFGLRLVLGRPDVVGEMRPSRRGAATAGRRRSVRSAGRVQVAGPAPLRPRPFSLFPTHGALCLGGGGSRRTPCVRRAGCTALAFAALGREADRSDVRWHVAEAAYAGLTVVTLDAHRLRREVYEVLAGRLDVPVSDVDIRPVGLEGLVARAYHADPASVRRILASGPGFSLVPPFTDGCGRGVCMNAELGTPSPAGIRPWSGPTD